MANKNNGTVDSPRFKCGNVLQCVLNLNSLEVLSYKTLVKAGPLKAEELAKELGKDRSTAYRCLRQLETCGICHKKKGTYKNGGYYYVYTAISPDKVKKRLKECIDEWYVERKEAIEGFPFDE